MTKNTFKVHFENGLRYVKQEIEEFDKNHREDSTELANDSKMYETPGKKTLKYSTSKFHMQNFKLSTFL